MSYTPANILFCAIVLGSISRHVQGDVGPVHQHNPGTRLTTNGHLQQQKQQKQGRMSCYVCSTMDYESSTDNICRTLRTESGLNHPHSQSTGHFGHFGHHQPSTTTTTSTTTISTTETSDQYDQSRLAVTEALVASPGSNEAFYTGATSNQPFSKHSTRFNQHNDTANVNTSLINFGSSTAPTTDNSSLYSQKRIIPQRPVMPNYKIETRDCTDDENFCSIVSVVRIEFVQESFYPKFWALERNCSKSCNTGCMTIGERVRLRVCSQCCRTPNCNFGSGTLEMRSFNIWHLMWILLIGSFARRFFTKYHDYQMF